MKRIIVIVAFGLSLAVPAWLSAQSDQPVAPAPQSQSTQPDSTTAPVPPAAEPQSSQTSDQTVQPAQPSQTDQSQSYQPPPPTQVMVQQGPPPPPEHSPYKRNHGEIGVFADYLRISGGGVTENFLGAGGRVGFNVHPHVALEAEMAYDFARNYTASVSNSVTTTFVTSSLRPLTGLFGPKFQFGTSGPIRAFVTGKAGFLEFSNSTSSSVTGNQFGGAFGQFGESTTRPAFYPGGGLEFFAGFLGFRLEAGDEIYLDNGTFNNLRATFGPVIRF